jgi:hypothetical protein
MCRCGGESGDSSGDCGSDQSGCGPVLSGAGVAGVAASRIQRILDEDSDRPVSARFPAGTGHPTLAARASAVSSRSRHTLGGLTDSAFRLIPILESGRDAKRDDLFKLGIRAAA